MLRHMFVVAGKDLDAHALLPERCDGRARARFWRIEENDESGKIRSRSSAAVAAAQSGSISRQATPSARKPSALSPSKSFVARIRAESSSGKNSDLPGSS